MFRRPIRPRKDVLPYRRRPPLVVREAVAESDKVVRQAEYDFERIAARLGEEQSRG